MKHTVLRGYQPQAVLSYFEDLCAIPHGSYNEAGAAAYLCAFAEAHGLAYRCDAMHNVLICKPASPGYENAPVVMLQGHTDMVCVKRADSAHDFTADGLRLIVEDGWIRADGTTLGGDDGIAVAMMLAILDDDTLAHPALECLFTVQEEVGLGGAAGFDYTGIRAKLLFNLDSEEDGVCTVSCAGGVRCDMERPVTWEECRMASAQIAVRGLKGGHSGAEIHMPRGNAHRIVGAILAALAQRYPYRIVSLTGGNMDNAIPRDCTAVIAFAQEDGAELLAMLGALCAEQQAMLSRDDRTEGRVVCTSGDTVCRCMSEADTAALLGLLCLTPNGIVTMCEDMPGLVESSCNMGVLCTDEDSVTLGFLARASVEARKEEIRTRLLLCARTFGAEMHCSGEYPGWAYDRDSAAMARYVRVYQRLWGKAPRVEAIHAGLECGLMKHAVLGLDPISIGPNMRDIHTPEERIEIDSIRRVYETVCAMLAEKD